MFSEDLHKFYKLLQVGRECLMHGDKPKVFGIQGAKFDQTSKIKASKLSLSSYFLILMQYILFCQLCSQC